MAFSLKGGQVAIAYGTFTSKYQDANVPPGEATGFKYSSAMATAGKSALRLRRGQRWPQK